MGLKKKLQIEQPKNDKAEMALLAWEIVGAVATVVMVTSVIAMLPELVRYLKLKSM